MYKRQVQDRIHQPYRSGLIENYDQVFRMSYELGSLGTYVSGAGPTIISMIPTEGAEEMWIRDRAMCTQEPELTR